MAPANDPSESWLMRLRHRKLIYWMLLLMSLAILQVALPTFIHSQVIPRQVLVKSDGSSLSQAQIDKRRARLEIMIVIPSADARRKRDQLQTCLETWRDAIDDRCVKGGRISFMVFDIDRYGNPAHVAFAKKYKELECFSFFKNTSKVFSHIFSDPEIANPERQYTLDIANILFSASRYHPEYHILLWNDDSHICNGAMSLIEQAAVIAGASGNGFGVVHSSHPGLSGTLISKDIAFPLSEFIAKADSSRTAVQAINDFIVQEKLPRYVATKNLLSSENDPKSKCGAKISIPEKCESGQITEINRIGYYRTTPC